MSRRYEMMIGGRSVPADDYREIRNPADTNEVVGLAPVGNPGHLDAAVSAAKEAFSSWRRTGSAERESACNAIADVVGENASELQELLTREQGKAPHVPFGGIKCSGLGVEFGQEGLEAYTTIKIINAAA